MTDLLTDPRGTTDLRAPARLVLGPLLRWAGERAATVWVETDRPCTVRVLGHEAPTFTVHGRHYGLVVVDGLEPGTATPYTVSLDAEPVWPEAGSPFPPSVIRTVDPGGRFRLSFGSCRLTMAPEKVATFAHGVDALRALAMQGARDPGSLPELLLFAGDQVYADELTDDLRAIVLTDDAGPRTDDDGVVNYEEFARLYTLAWGEPGARWLLSTVPTAMIFDDHDVHDDWNTSHAWREQVLATDWWRPRVTAALGSYWVYQHLGNLPPEELATDPLLRALREAPGDGAALLDEFAWRADQDPRANRWSHRRDFGAVRVLVVDTRCGRLTAESERTMADDVEWDWCAEQARAEGVRHLLIASSLPWLLPEPIHDAEGWDEALVAGAWGPRWARWGEKLRQGADLEHWAAFRRSFDALSDLLRDVATRPGGPDSVVVLSGDVHYSYLARARFPGAEGAPVWQAVCSPMRNPLGGALRWVNLVAFWRPFALPARALARRAGVREKDLSWSIQRGPWFDNALATVEVDGPAARIRWDGAAAVDGSEGLVELGRADLAGGVDEGHGGGGANRWTNRRGLLAGLAALVVVGSVLARRGGAAPAR